MERAKELMSSILDFFSEFGHFFTTKLLIKNAVFGKKSAINSSVFMNDLFESVDLVVSRVLGNISARYPRLFTLNYPKLSCALIRKSAVLKKCNSQKMHVP